MPNIITGRESGVYFKGYLDGGPQLKAKLDTLAKGLRDDLLVQSTAAAAEVIADEWRSEVRAKIGLGPPTGHYVDAIGTRARPGKIGATAWVGLPNPVPLEPGEAHPRDYAPRLEFGHYKGGIHQPPQPTLRPAFMASRQRALDTMAKVLAELIDKAVG